jgi:hypothetical protein
MTSKIQIGTKVKFIHRNCFFEGLVMDIEVEEEEILRNSVGMEHRFTRQRSEPVLYVAVQGQKEMFVVPSGNTITVFQ